MANTLTYYGHATLGLNIDGHQIIVDPFFTDNPQATQTAEDVKELDYIWLTHGHGDHVGDTLALAKRTGATVISNFEIYNWLQGQGLEKLHPQHIGGGFNHPFGYLRMTIAHHGSVLPDGSNGGNPGGFLLRPKSGAPLYIAGDTALTMDMQLLADEGIGLAVLPIGDNFTMGPEEALRAVKFIKPKKVMPVHFSTWPPIEQDGAAFAKAVSEKTDAEGIFVRPGTTIELP